MTIQVDWKSGYSQQVENHAGAVTQTAPGGRPHGLTAIGIFLFFGATMAGLAGITLVWPGTGLDKIWVLNANAHAQLKPFCWKVGIPLLMLSAALVAAGVGWVRRRVWGWKLAVAIIATQVLGDLVNLLRADFVRGGAGVTIAGALLLYLLRRDVRTVFAKDDAGER